MRLTGSLGAAVVAVSLAAATAACSTDSGAASGDDGPVAVDFGYIPDFNGTSLLAIAEDQGLWEKHGVEVTTSSFTNGPLQIQALGTGDLDFGYIGPGAFWLPASGQAKIVAMNTLGQADRVVGQPGNEAMEDLRGKTVAVPEGTSGDMILTLALRDAGMTRDDIEVVPMEPAAIVAALSSGQVDGAGLWYPALATVKEQVPDLVEIAENSDFEDEIAFPTAFVAGNDVVANEQEKVDRVIAALREAITYRAANMDETIELTAEFNDLDPADVAADAANVQVLTLEELDALTEDGSVDTWLTGMVDYFVDAGQLSDPVEPGEFYTADQFLSAGQGAR
ncbi:aliphatic sulfonate ABC transporter substrate-binding protein [Myceligenerans pegani]|uniref:Aliphatic sulfonate ABC transporter substrate-binding protein n=1 Tax=Myceligenerans pegani TaxID=2776917 RepID=A0ABR9N5W5_9MICO|nr:aliphatic sulfonate ABC transporter substrate-binding protein [Myceligenerans sp. TRM 65318]MBE1878407.1 aliphatic sulfonate ABC transporter substrate-binding protein [Myceligenerans sp. TRM 65318]MBE3020678.1 aliphatic sulfonate ABC transporter substrate-binding protein [Myceligenerans sp. TRM 65318]